MPNYLSASYFRDKPKLEEDKVGWEDSQGEAVKNRLIRSYSRYSTAFEKAKNYANAFEVYSKKVDAVLKKDEPRLRSL